MGYVYKYTHKETGMWYIGSHNGLKEKYSGSGLIWQKAKQKYGLESFDYEILYEGDNYRDEEESILKALNAADDSMSYNMKNQAMGGSFPKEKNGMYGKKLTTEQKYKCGSAFRGKKRPDHSKKMSGKNNPRYGKNDHCHGILKKAEENQGKTYEEIHGYEKAKELRESFSRDRKGKKHNLKRVSCPHCGLIGKGPNMTRYHFDNCKLVKE